ncbi:glycosyltransferase [Geoglobus acetivorans]|uniref:Glycosyltransferase family 2 protein n=1 Tax=Geoglobus acetivorans TaxID=565033 RepID=A0ABZ3H2W8_GEOAI|nr:glycosyltransferase family 2 protein [Geoglobus acetivorans]
MKKFPRVSIIILNWNGWKDTIECLESLYQITYPNYDVIVVDNGSEDDSVQKIKEYCESRMEVNSKFFEYNPKNKPIKVFEISEDKARKGKFNRPLYEKFDVDRRLILIENKENYGFAKGNNVGIKFALSVLNPDYVLLLNNDTVVDKNFLNELVKVAESDKSIGIIGPKVYYYDFDGKSNVVHSRGGKVLPKLGLAPPIGNSEVDTNYAVCPPYDVDYVEGSCLLAKSKIIKNIGLLNETLFSYWEEVDFCLKAIESKHRVVCTTSSKIWHKVSSSIGKTHPIKLYYMARNKHIIIKNHYNVLNLSILIIYSSIDALISVIVYWIKYNCKRCVISLLMGHIEGIMNNIHTLKNQRTPILSSILK